MAAAAVSAGSSSSSPCGACKFLRRKCTPECIFAPYFPPDQPIKFANAHKIFGASNISKILNELHPHHRAAAVNSLAYEAEARIKDPVYGCVGAISYLKRHIDLLERELRLARAELARYMGIGLIDSEQQQQQQQAGRGSGVAGHPPNVGLHLPGANSSAMCHDHMLGGSDGSSALIQLATGNTGHVGRSGDVQNMMAGVPRVPVDQSYWLQAASDQIHGSSSLYEAEFVGDIEAMQLAARRTAQAGHFRGSHMAAAATRAIPDGPSMNEHLHVNGRSGSTSMNEGAASNISTLCSP